MRLILLLMVSLAGPTEVWANGLKEGGYGGDGNVELHLRLLPQRVGSALGLMVDRESRQVHIYLIDPLRGGRFAMVPLGITSHNSIGVLNENPSLVATLFQSGNDQQLAIQGANSDNKIGFTGPYTLSFGKVKMTWIKLVPGIYGTEGREKALAIGGFDPTNRMSDATFSATGLNGSFLMNERLSGLFVLNSQAVFATGEEINRVPKSIGVFIETKGVMFSPTRTELVLFGGGDTKKSVSIFELNGTGQQVVAPAQPVQQQNLRDRYRRYPSTVTEGG